MENQIRPASVIALGVFEIVTGAVFLLGGGALLTFASRGSGELYSFGLSHIPIAASFLALGTASLFMSNRLVWTLGLAATLFSIADDLVAFAFVPLPYDGVIGTAVVLVTALVVLYLLVRLETRSFFVQGQGKDHVR